VIRIGIVCDTFRERAPPAGGVRTRIQSLDRETRSSIIRVQQRRSTQVRAVGNQWPVKI
jgi:hypothetical protein